jgi:hypothetical protein
MKQSFFLITLCLGLLTIGHLTAGPSTKTPAKDLKAFVSQSKHFTPAMKAHWLYAATILHDFIESPSTTVDQKILDELKTRSQQEKLSSARELYKRLIDLILVPISKEAGNDLVATYTAQMEKFYGKGTASTTAAGLKKSINKKFPDKKTALGIKKELKKGKTSPSLRHGGKRLKEAHN